MSQSPSITAAGQAAVRTVPVRASIARAAQATGTDFRYLMAQAKIESSLDPEARAPTSSAAGLYQFTKATWLQTLDRHGAQHGLGWAQEAITDGRVADPALRAQILALRHDPEASARMAAELARGNRAALSAQLGREPDATELYLAHFLGAGGAGQFLSVLASDPGRSAASVLPQAAAANRAVFFEPTGAARTVAGVMDAIATKMRTAMEEDGGGVDAWQGSFTPDPASISSFYPRASTPGGAEPTRRPSMADTLAATFSAASPDAPVHVRAAYGRLRALGL